jgi:hypothetical protein
MSKYAKRSDELEKDIRALCNKYEEFSLIAIIENAEGDREHIQIAGNLCALCALEDLTGIILKEGLTHQKVSPLVDMPVDEKKH